MFRVLAHPQFGLLQLVYLLIDTFEAGVISSAEILSSGNLRNAAECPFVKLGIHRYVLHAHRRLYRHAGLTVTAYTYRINADTECLDAGGEVDIAKAAPVLFEFPGYNYISMGKVLGKGKTFAK